MAEPIMQSGRSRRFFAASSRLLASRWIAGVAVGLALLLTFRAIGNGLHVDDFFHRAVLSGSERFGERLPGPQGMFRFVPGNPEVARGWMEDGFMPWWTDPMIKAEFMQLIPTQTHILDYRFWPERPEWMHAQSLLWFALLVFLAARFYRRILGPTWPAGVAALLFALEDPHGWPAGLLCGRNILIAASFGIGCLMAHDAWRRKGRKGAAWLAVLLWALALCSKEEGIGACAFLFAYALWLDEAPPWRRFLTLVPYGVVLVTWRVVRDALGFGVAHMGLYVDPITDPYRFATALLERYPVFLLGQWAIPSDLGMLCERLLGSPFWWFAVVFCVLLGLLFRPLLRRDRVARFFATGMLLAVIPVCATFPADRLLMFVGLGAFGLLARFWAAVIAAGARREGWTPLRAVAVVVALVFLLVHLVVAPVMLPVRAVAFRGLDPFYVRMPFDDSIAGQDLVVVNAPIPMLAGSCLLAYEHEGKPAPRAVRSLAPGVFPVTVRRSDERTLEVEADFLGLIDGLFRNEENALVAGERVELERMTVRVLAVADGRPRKVAFRFEMPLEDKSLRWIRFRAGAFVPWMPPDVGEEVVLKAGWLPSVKRGITEIVGAGSPLKGSDRR